MLAVSDTHLLTLPCKKLTCATALLLHWPTWRCADVATTSCAGLNGSSAGRLLRYDLQATLWSDKDVDFVELSTMKGIIEEKRVRWSDYAPIMVTQLPFYIRAEIGAPVRPEAESPEVCNSLDSEALEK